VLILDEPTGSVDPVAAHGLLELITDIVDSRKIAALISSHRLEEIEALHSHVILLDKGSVRYDGDLDELRRQYDRARLEFEFSDDTAAASAESILLRSRSLENVSRDGKEVLVTLQQDARISAVLADLGAGVDSLVHIRESRTPLRDILASMYAGST
jgi:ABC-2 type transport system ATP-binding protein